MSCQRSYTIPFATSRLFNVLSTISKIPFRFCVTAYGAGERPIGNDVALERRRGGCPANAEGCDGASELQDARAV